MATAGSLIVIDPLRLKPFSPLNALSDQGLRRVAEACQALTLPAGHILFTRGTPDPDVYFLLAGEIQLRASGQDDAPLIVRAGSETSYHPLSRLKPRRYTAVARTPITVAVIDEDVLDNLLTLDQTAAYEVTELPGEDPDWMFQLLRQPAFMSLPATHLANLFARLTRLSVRGGETIVRQGQPGDYYYLIREGRAVVSRKSPEGKATVLAVLGRGDGFGEEALLSGDPRNATVTMLDDGILMRLSHEDFNATLRPPLVRWMDPREAMAQAQSGAQLIDVRLEDEYRSGSLEGSLNIPLYMLRLRAKTLDPKRKLIFFCQSDRRSSVAAFLMRQRGFDAYAMRGGLTALS